MGTKGCPRRRIHNTENGLVLYCSPLVVPEDLNAISDPSLYCQQRVTIEECEACLNKRLPSLRQRIFNYTTAVYAWTKAGGKERSNYEVTRLFNICKGCIEFQHGICRDCGCPVSLGTNPLTNKLKMDTTECGKGLW